jgi:phage-related protein
MSWEIEYYKTPGGQEVIKDFIDNLQESSQAKLGRQLDLLEQYGYELGMPHAKSMGDGLMELRVRSGRGSQEVRVFYAFVMRNRIYLLHGFVKKSQATPKKELDLARQRKAEMDNL